MVVIVKQLVVYLYVRRFSGKRIICKIVVRANVSNDPVIIILI